MYQSIDPDHGIIHFYFPCLYGCGYGYGTPASWPGKSERLPLVRTDICLALEQGASPFFIPHYPPLKNIKIKQQKSTGDYVYDAIDSADKLSNSCCCFGSGCDCYDLVLAACFHLFIMFMFIFEANAPPCAMWACHGMEIAFASRLNCGASTFLCGAALIVAGAWKFFIECAMQFHYLFSQAHTPHSATHASTEAVIKRKYFTYFTIFLVNLTRALARLTCPDFWAILAELANLGEWRFIIQGGRRID